MNRPLVALRASTLVAEPNRMKTAVATKAMKTQIQLWRATIPLLTALAGGVFLPSTHAADANPPAKLTYQGYLVDATGTPLANTSVQNFDVVFRIYGASQGGTSLWTEQLTVTVDKGNFSVLLGESNTTVGSEPHPALDTVFTGADVSDRYIGITVKGLSGGDAEIAPRLRLLTSPYAFLAKNATQLVSPSGTPLVTVVNGAIQSTGGSARGTAAVDLQTTRVNAAQVAAGAYSVVGGGQNNRAANVNSVVVGGAGNTVSGDHGFIGGGRDQVASGAGSAVVGGIGNSATNYNAFVGAGDGNQARGGNSAIAGGMRNIAGGATSVIAGGFYNLANGVDSAITGGNANSSGGAQSFIGGGLVNTNSGFANVISGGFLNKASGDHTAVGGGGRNAATGHQSTIAGGFGNVATGIDSVIAGGYTNYATGLRSAVSGGVDNHADGEASSVGGGSGNRATGLFSRTDGGLNNNASGTQSAIGGGHANSATALNSSVGGGFANANAGVESAIGGGNGNNITQGSFQTIGGGLQNRITAANSGGTIGGGLNNLVDGANATVPGGYGNKAIWNHSFAAGRRAVANHPGAFVWSDTFSDLEFASERNNQVLFRATGGFVIQTAGAVTPANGGTGTGVTLGIGGNAWLTFSDKNMKKNISPVDEKDILAKLDQIPVNKWIYKTEDESTVPHIGPMAQDFKQAFYPGRDDKAISTLEFDGVELAAIKGLHQIVKDKDAELQAVKGELKELRAMIESLTKAKAAGAQ